MACYPRSVAPAQASYVARSPYPSRSPRAHRPADECREAEAEASYVNASMSRLGCQFFQQSRRLQRAVSRALLRRRRAAATRLKWRSRDGSNAELSGTSQNIFDCRAT